MKKFITSKTFTIRYGWECKDISEKTDSWATLRYYTSFDELEKKLEELLLILNDNQYTIKGIMPLTTSQGTTSGSAGSGISQNVGFVVFAEKEEMLSDEVYEARLNEVKLKPIEKELSELENEEIIIKEITEKSAGFLGGTIHFYVGENKFDNRNAAESFKKSLEEKKEKREERIKELKAIRDSYLNG